MSELRGILDRTKAGKLTASRAESEIRLAAQDLASTLGVKGPPADLNTFMKARSILQTRRISMDEDGILYALDDAALAVDLKSSNPESRNRFTCAHEIGHTFFVDKTNKEWFRSFRVADGEVERPAESNAVEEGFCNLFAGELLLPTEYLRQQLFRHGTSWRTIFTIQEETNNSLTACALRGVQSGLTKAMLISWRLLRSDAAGSDYRVHWQLSAPSVQTKIDTVATTVRQPLLHRALTAGPQDRIVVGQMELPTQRGGTTSFYSESICISRSSGAILSLLVLERNAEVFGSLAQKWFRKPSPQMDLFR